VGERLAAVFVSPRGAPMYPNRAGRHLQQSGVPTICPRLRARHGSGVATCYPSVMKKWLLEHLLIPILRELLLTVVQAAAKMLMDFVRALIKRWRDRDEAVAKTPEEVEAVRAKWDGREKDFEDVASSFDVRVASVVEQAIREWNDTNGSKYLTVGRGIDKLPSARSVHTSQASDGPELRE